jgi:sugar phosphate permease
MLSETKRNIRDIVAVAAIIVGAIVYWRSDSATNAPQLFFLVVVGFGIFTWGMVAIAKKR